MGDSQFNISGTVGLETAGAVEGIKQVRSEIQNLSQSGIAGFEAARQKVIDLTKRIAELRTQLLQTNDPAAQAKLNAALAQTQKEFTAARGALRGMSLESREASEKAQLLAAQLGVQLPQGLDRFIARMPAVQQGLQAAFSLSLIGAFAGALVAAIVQMVRGLDELTDTTADFKSIMDEAAESNRKAFVSFRTTAEGYHLIAESNRALLAVQEKYNQVFTMQFKPGLLSLAGPVGGMVELYKQWKQRAVDLSAASA